MRKVSAQEAAAMGIPLTISQVSELVGVSASTVYEWVSNGVLEVLRLPGAKGRAEIFRIPYASVQKFLAENLHTPKRLSILPLPAPPRDFVGEASAKRKRGRPRKSPAAQGGAP